MEIPFDQVTALSFIVTGLFILYFTVKAISWCIESVVHWLQYRYFDKHNWQAYALDTDLGTRVYCTRCRIRKTNPSRYNKETIDFIRKL